MFCTVECVLNVSWTVIKKPETSPERRPRVLGARDYRKDVVEPSKGGSDPKPGGGGDRSEEDLYDGWRRVVEDDPTTSSETVEVDTGENEIKGDSLVSLAVFWV